MGKDGLLVDAEQTARIECSAMVAAEAVRRTALAGALFVACLAVASCGGGDDKTAEANGKVKIVYDDDVKPESRDAVELLRKSRALEPLAGWVNKRVALPHDLMVKVTDKVPPGVADMVTQPAGRTIYIPPAFVNDIKGAAENIVKTVERPAVFPEDKWNTDDLSALSSQFIFGHEMGHALQRQFLLPNLGFEEDAADGFAQFYAINERPDSLLAGAILFDEIARMEGKLTLEGLSSDHPVTQQRVFNFLCLLDGSDPHRWDGPLVDSGYLTKSRAPLCPQSWTAMNYGWWTQLEPHFREAFKDQGTKEQENARAEHIAETKAFAKKLDEIRAGSQ
jgi:Putative metallopeptidase